MRVLPVALGLGLLFALVAVAGAEDRPRIDRIVITGNQRVEEEAIRVQLRSQAGSRINEETIDNDVRALYRMGFFDNVDVDQIKRFQADWTEFLTTRKADLLLSISQQKALSPELTASLKAAADQFTQTWKAAPAAAR